MDILFDSVSASYEVAKQTLRNQGCKKCSDEDIFDFIAKMNRLNWKELFDEVGLPKNYIVLRKEILGKKGLAIFGKVYLKQFLEDVVRDCIQNCGDFEIVRYDNGCLTINNKEPEDSSYFEIREITSAGMRAYASWFSGNSYKSLSDLEFYEKLAESTTNSKNVDL